MPGMFPASAPITISTSATATTRRCTPVEAISHGGGLGSVPAGASSGLVGYYRPDTPDEGAGLPADLARRAWRRRLAFGTWHGRTCDGIQALHALDRRQALDRSRAESPWRHLQSCDRPGHGFGGFRDRRRG